MLSAVGHGPEDDGPGHRRPAQEVHAALPRRVQPAASPDVEELGAGERAAALERGDAGIVASPELRNVSSSAPRPVQDRVPLLVTAVRSGAVRNGRGVPPLEALVQQVSVTGDCRGVITRP